MFFPYCFTRPVIPSVSIRVNVFRRVDDSLTMCPQSGMKAILRTLRHALKSIVNVVVLYFSVFFIFSIMGVQFFSGGFYSCTDPSAAGSADCMGEFIAVDAQSNPLMFLPRVWRAPNYGFDNVFAAFATLFEVSTGEGWLSVLYSAVDSRGQELQPLTDNNYAVSLFFIVFMVITSFFVVQLVRRYSVVSPLLFSFIPLGWVGSGWCLVFRPLCCHVIAVSLGSYLVRFAVRGRACRVFQPDYRLGAAHLGANALDSYVIVFLSLLSSRFSVGPEFLFSLSSLVCSLLVCQYVSFVHVTNLLTHPPYRAAKSDP